MKKSQVRRIINLPFGTITVYSKNKELCGGVLNSGRYNTFFSEVNYNVYLGWDFENVDTTYRATQMKKGIYLGHNVGEPCKLHICQNDIHIYTENEQLYDKIFWSFVVKYIFTKACLDNDILHLKATLLRDIRDGMCVVLLGKGGSGKTTLADKLCERNFELLSNTHCMVKDDYIWGVNSWVRRRKNSIEKYELEKKDFILDGVIKKCIMVEGNSENNKLHIETLTIDEKYYYLKNFSAAISNYDLKEEVCDYMAENNTMIVEYLKKEDELVKRFSEREILWIKLDSFEKECIEQLIDEI